MKEYKKGLVLAGCSFLVVLFCMAGASFSSGSTAFAIIMVLAILMIPLALVSSLIAYFDEKVRGFRKPKEELVEEPVESLTEYKKCPYCAEEIKVEAVVCRYCGKNFKEEEKKKKNQEADKKFLSGCFIIIFIPVLVIAAFIGYYSSHPIQSSQTQKPDKIQAYVAAEQIVAQRLKAPRTAKFCGFHNARVIEYEPGKFTVMGWVDSQNSFGAMMRTDFNVVLEHTSPNNWNILEFHTN